jgi:hypothetical protein
MLVLNLGRDVRTGLTRSVDKTDVRKDTPNSCSCRDMAVAHNPRYPGAPRFAVGSRPTRSFRPPPDAERKEQLKELPLRFTSWLRVPSCCSTCHPTQPCCRSQPTVEQGSVNAAEVGVELEVASVEVRQAGMPTEDALHRRSRHEQRGAHCSPRFGRKHPPPFRHATWYSAIDRMAWTTSRTR